MEEIKGSKGIPKRRTKVIVGFVLGILIVLLLLIITTVIIPNVSKTSILANEINAVGHLRNLYYVEKTWKQQDIDGNGQQDFWTYDVSCLYRIASHAKKTPFYTIDLKFAQADIKPAQDNTFGPQTIEPWTKKYPVPVAINGYLYRALTYDENKKLYNQNTVNSIPATNDFKYGFIAVPRKYRIDGVRIFIVNQTGTIWAINPGSDANKWIDQWPGQDPMIMPGPGGEDWGHWGVIG